MTDDSGPDEVTPSDEELDKAIAEFHVAENALRQFNEAAGELRTAQDEIQAAEEHLQAVHEDTVRSLQQVCDDASARLERAQQGVADDSSSVFRLSEELTGIARDLGDATQVVRKFEPERMSAAIDDLVARHRALDDSLADLDDSHLTTHQELEVLREAHQSAAERSRSLVGAVVWATRWAAASTCLVAVVLVLIVLR